MKAFIKIIKLQPMQLKSNPYGLLLIILLPVIVLSALAYRNAPKSDPNVLSIAVVDKDESETSRLVNQRLSQNGLIKIRAYPDPMRALMRMDIDALFVMKKGFGEKILSGDIGRTVELYYAPGNVTGEIIAEIFSKEVMRIYVSEQALDFLESEYKKRGAEFSAQLREEAEAYTESFWQKGVTVPVEYRYMDGMKNETASEPLRDVITIALESGVLLFLILCLGAGLVRQKENGIMLRLRLCGVSGGLYCAVSMVWYGALYALSLLAMLTVAGEGNSWLDRGLYFIWAGLLAAVMARFFKKERSYMLAAPLLAVALPFLGGAAFYMKDIFPALKYLGYLNPVYCIMLGAGISVHIAVVILLVLAVTAD